ncbi:Acyl-[acyl-carrier-protein]--UDP-N-acetylglucosamine O-acyltransferase [Planctomycetes bacterium CA13]|uniref:Acyl-[acyl-carrier-protein]--UDP-N-acetylglucosamine O-acyltransferase n=1 Tax=Novipirellula herctigrandis TaxID=2527986 RepID=A0A5C5Z0L9_9BACT|nr:Acyl-[acyl-carrier-protein]--UDP-N-acetylglucosamine O-acyltransferase [Planctomycetes bacterium CA13]
MGTMIAQTAVVDPRAKLGKNVRIGHFCVIGPDVQIGDECLIEDHVVLTGDTVFGEENHVFPGSVIGADPQDTSYKGAPTKVCIGDGNVFREYCTVNRATEKEDGITRVGNNNYFMASAHVAHDCCVGDRNVMANNVMLGGHAHIGNDITIAGGAGVSHFASIGSLSFVSAMSRVLHDVPPFMIVDGQPAKPRAVNSIGLKRHGYSKEDTAALTKAYRLLYRSYVGVDSAREQLLSTGPIRPVLRELFDFLEYSVGGDKGRGRDRRRKAA